MHGIGKTVAASALSLLMLGGMAVAQDHHDDHRDDHGRPGYVHHEEWKHGYHMQQADWARAQRVADWRAAHLSAPPRGYEWRSVDGYYVLASPAGVVQTTVVIP